MQPQGVRGPNAQPSEFARSYQEKLLRSNGYKDGWVLGSSKIVQEVGAEGSGEKSSGYQVQGQDCLALLIGQVQYKFQWGGEVWQKTGPQKRL